MKIPGIEVSSIWWEDWICRIYLSYMQTIDVAIIERKIRSKVKMVYKSKFKDTVDCWRYAMIQQKFMTRENVIR